MSIGKITNVGVSGPSTLRICWDDARSASIDLAEVIAKLTVLHPLKNPAEFASVALASDGWSVEWPCGIDFGSPQLRRWADEQSGATMPASAFRRWMEVHGLTLDSAADALGLSRRMIAYYLSGEQVIPKTVMLATEGYNHRQAA